MVDGHMCCGLNRAGLLVRVGREAHERALALPHVQPLKIGKRSAAGFVRVDPGAYRGDAALAAWIQRGIDFVAMLTAKTTDPGRSGSRRQSVRTAPRSRASRN